MSGSELAVTGGRPLVGRLRVPGCKGISHRALLLAAMAQGASRLRGLAPGADVASTRAAVAQLGVIVRPDGADGVVVDSGGIGALHEPDDVVDCGNSGTTLRLLAGLLAGRPGLAVLTGDASLRSRPMARVLTPLRALGADVDGAGGGTRAPLVVRGAALTGTRCELAVASGQVKTALVLAGLQAAGETEIVEPAPSRDHTERMLAALGAPLRRVDAVTVRVRAGALPAFELTVPGDASSAAFFVVAATLVAGSDLTLTDVSLNPGRIAYLDALRAMGARIEVVATGEHVGEPVGDIRVQHAPLRGTVITSSESIVDELPVLAVAAAFAEGATEIRDAAELAVKESNRITTLAAVLERLGVRVDTSADGMVVHGGAPRGAVLDGAGDHRIAMAAAVAAAAIPEASTVVGWDAVAISYPDSPPTSIASGAARVIVIAIDGPAGAGKSTIGRGVAAALGLRVLDTGAMYRALTVAAQEAGVDLDDADALAGVAEAMDLELADGDVRLGGRDVRDAVRAPAVTHDVSLVAAHPAVRAVLVRRQRAWVLAADGGVVEGRDIGTVVFPDARLKVFVTASDAERARRRQRDERDAARDVELESVRDALVRRDRLDASLGRALSEDAAAPDAIVIDTTDRSAESVVAEIVERVRRA